MHNTLVKLAFQVDSNTFFILGRHNTILDPPLGLLIE